MRRLGLTYRSDFSTACWVWGLPAAELDDGEYLDDVMCSIVTTGSLVSQY
jgi:hypothetical protein